VSKLISVTQEDAEVHAEVDSTNIKTFSYNYNTQELTVYFHKSRHVGQNLGYIYFDVPAEIFAQMLKSDSVGAFINKNIAFKYRMTRTA
jgi:hypothetical protein